MRKRKEGFTLIELLIVMAVIAALMGALIPVALNAIKHANATRIAENLRSIESAVQNYAYSEHKLPSLNTLVNKNYLTGKIDTSEYGIYYYDASNTKWDQTNNTSIKGNVTIAIVYSGSAANPTDVYNAWQEATSVTNFATSTDLPSAGVGVTTVIARYW